MRTVADYELEEMCMQYEREDLIKVYLHKPSDFGTLSIAEEDAIIAQADGHLKNAKGKAMLPRIDKEDVKRIFLDLPRDDYGTFSFHDAQKKIREFRADRIRRYKLVFPNLTSGPKRSKKISAEPAADDGDLSSMGSFDNFKPPGALYQTSRFIVSENTAPRTMFQRNKGQSNSQVTEQTTKFLSKHAFKITGEKASATDTTMNVRLLRDLSMKHTIADTFKSTSAARLGGTIMTRTGQNTLDGTYGRIEYDKNAKLQPYWNNTCTLKGMGMGSKVKGIGGSTTWKQKATLC
jgi:hypothetical protein